MKNKYRVFYLSSLAVLIALSVYPLYMGISTFIHYLQGGSILAEYYPKYIIPYTPMCLAVIIAAALLPLIYKLTKRFSLLIDSIVGVGLFFAAEVFFEQIKVIEGFTTLTLDSWQYGLCSATPEVLEAIGEPIYADNNPAYKVHFYLIALVIILSVIGILYGFLKMLKENNYQKKKPLIIQTVCVAVFIGLCVLACFTAFYRNGTLYISAVSAFLTSLFFIVFGVTSGTYLSAHFFKRKPLLSIWIPSIIALLTTAAMYVGELVLMGGSLFVLGNGVFFIPLGRIPFSVCDIMIILTSGIITGVVSLLLNRQAKGFNVPEIPTVGR